MLYTSNYKEMPFLLFKAMHYFIAVTPSPPVRVDFKDSRFYPPFPIWNDWISSNHDENAWQLFRRAYYNQVLKNLDAKAIVREYRERFGIDSVVFLGDEDLGDPHSVRNIISDWLNYNKISCEEIKR